jgi:hypothetical protein
MHLTTILVAKMTLKRLKTESKLLSTISGKYEFVTSQRTVYVSYKMAACQPLQCQ